jgi:hypothetical protein
MTMQFTDIADNVKASPGYAGTTISTNTDTNGGITIDMQGFESLMFAVYSATRTDGSYVLKINETDNADGTTGAAEVASYQVQNTMTTSNAVGKVGARPSKRYCRLVITSTGVTTGCVFKGAIAIQGGARNNPVA